MAPPNDTPPAATVPATVPGQRPDVDAARARLAADTFIVGALDDDERAVNLADQAVREGGTVEAAMWLTVAQSSREDAHRAARVIGRVPR